MAKVKVRILYPTAFEAMGVDAGAEEVAVEESQATDLIAQGYAELLKPAKAEPVKPEKAASK